VEGCADTRLAARTFKLSRNDAGIVEDQDISGAQQPGEVANQMVRQRVGADAKQPCALFRLGRAERDPLRRQLEIE
jgi:hypothetical protein